MVTMFSLLAMLEGDGLRDLFRSAVSSECSKESIISDVMSCLAAVGDALGAKFEERRAVVQRALEEERFGLINGLIQGWRPRWQLRNSESGFQDAVPELKFPGANNEEDVKFLLGEGVTPNPMDSNIVALLTAVGFDFNSLPEWLRELPRKEATEEDITSYREQLRA